jgi:hypothetical protein
MSRYQLVLEKISKLWYNYIANEVDYDYKRKNI